MKIRRITTEETLPLRNLVLRPGQPMGSSQFAGDATAVHFGLEHEGEIVCVVTAHPEGAPSVAAAKNPWRIRGMATLTKYQGQGLGSAVLKALLDYARESGIDWYWCNAREKAIPFYERHGFEAVSDLFEIPVIGPHKIMRRKNSP